MHIVGICYKQKSWLTRKIDQSIKKLATSSPAVNPTHFPLVTACRRRDMAVLDELVRRARGFLGCGEVHILTHRKNFRSFKGHGIPVYFHDQDTIIPGMTLESLRARKDLPEMPLAAGWYFQQFLKLAIWEHFPGWERYLVWDSDTLPLRPIETFDSARRMIFTTSAEWHEPYFQSLRQLFEITPVRNSSFISQHIPVSIGLVRDMSAEVNARFPGNQHWTWKIMENLPGEEPNRFSEYETLAHFTLARHPALCVVRDLPWTRRGAELAGRMPQREALEGLSKSFAFAAFESNSGFLRKMALSIYTRLPEKLRKKIRRGN